MCGSDPDGHADHGAAERTNRILPGAHRWELTYAAGCDDNLCSKQAAPSTSIIAKRTAFLF